METNAIPKVSCVVNYAYEASEPDELSVKPGDVLRDVERLPGGWWKGELRGRRGMFPDNFVTVLAEHTAPSARSNGVQGRCRAVFSYQPANPDELPLYVGDVLDVLGEVEEGWWQGRRQGEVGVFPSNFVVMLEPVAAAPDPAPAPALPPKPVKEQCRVLFPYTAENEDELSLAEGDVVTLVSREAPDRGWWRGELHGRVGLFPDNFVQLLPTVAQEVEEKKPERPPPKSSGNIYPILNKYTEKTASIKELTTSKISSHKDNMVTKESSSHTTVTHTNKNESEKLIHSESVVDGAIEIKKPPVPLKKSPTPTSGVVGVLLSGLKNKMLSSSDKEKEKSAPTPAPATAPAPAPVPSPAQASTVSSSGSSSSGEWDRDRADGGAASKPTATNNNNNNNTNTFDHVARNSILNDPRAGRVKAPRRRPPSQVFRDDTLTPVGLSNGHEGGAGGDKPSAVADRAEEIKPRAREWEKHKAPWMEELKLNQAKKTTFVEGKARSASASSDPKPPAATTDRIPDCSLEEKRSTHSMEMSKSTSSISNRISVLENFEEIQTKTRHSLDSKREGPAPPEPVAHSPTAAGRTLLSMLEEIKKPDAPPPPVTAPPAAASVHTSTDPERACKSPGGNSERVFTEHNSFNKSDRTSTVERLSHSFTKSEERVSERSGVGSLERRPPAPAPAPGARPDRSEAVEALVAQLNCRISNLEKLLEVQNAKFNAAMDELSAKLSAETEKRQALQREVEKLAQCVTQV